MREQALWKWELGGKAGESVPGRENSKCKHNKLKHVWGGQEKAGSHKITASKVGQNWEPSDFHKLTTQMVFPTEKTPKEILTLWPAIRRAHGCYFLQEAFLVVWVCRGITHFMPAPKEFTALEPSPHRCWGGRTKGGVKTKGKVMQRHCSSSKGGTKQAQAGVLRGGAERNGGLTSPAWTWGCLIEHRLEGFPCPTKQGQQSLGRIV